MDELASNNEVQFLHEVLMIYVATNGAKETMFTWGGLTASPDEGNPVSDGGLNREKSAEAIVPASMPVYRGDGKGRTSDTTFRSLKVPTMTSQRKRLQSYLKGRGLEVLGTDGAGVVEVRNSWGALNVPDLMDRVLDKENFHSAVQRVVANKGAPGVDGMSAQELPGFVEQNWERIYWSLRTGRYRPSPVRRVRIPKPDGGERELGIPTLLDRAVQQAIAQVLTPIYEPLFSDNSHGFRPNRSAHQAVLAMKQHYLDGYIWAVDIDLSKYFDTLNHELLMNIIRRDVYDETLLVTIKAFLKSGVMDDGVVHEMEEGSPQGGNLSPLLANIYLNEFDRLLEERGHRFCRYADDIMILVRSERAAERVMSSSRDFLENTLKLKVNQDKSTVGKLPGLKFLGFTISDCILRDKGRRVRIVIHPKSLKRFKGRTRSILRERSHWSVIDTSRYFTTYVRGWLGYYALSEDGFTMKHLAQWSRRKLRARLWSQWKTPRNRYRKLMEIMPEGMGVYHPVEGCLVHARAHGPWHMSAFRPLQSILSNRYLESLGFPDILKMYEDNHIRLMNRRVREVRTVV